MLASAVLWTALALLALRGLRRRHLRHHDGGVPSGLLAAALALAVVVLVLSGLSPPHPGNLLAAGVGMIALCAASALLTRPRHVPFVLLPALVGQAVLVRAADTAADTARYVADTVTVVAPTAATSAVIVRLERSRRAGVRAPAEAAVTDPLTGLLDRRGVEQRFEARHRVARLRGERVSAGVAHLPPREDGPAGADSGDDGRTGSAAVLLRGPCGRRPRPPARRPSPSTAPPTPGRRASGS